MKKKISTLSKPPIPSYDNEFILKIKYDAFKINENVISSSSGTMRL